jgi:tRNA(His) 5'-end guanylyltransferase
MGEAAFDSFPIWTNKDDLESYFKHRQVSSNVSELLAAA